MKKTARTINKILKAISTIIFIFLILVIILISVYILKIKIMEKNNRLGEVKTNFYTILTQSMYPKIHAGDVVMSYKLDDSSSYEVGDIITFISRSNNGITITHKIVKKEKISGEIFYSTRGENNNSSDPALVSEKDVIGKVILKLPKAGYIQQFLVTKTGWIIAIVLPSLAIIIYDIVKLFENIIKVDKKSKIKKDDKEKENLEKLLKEENIEDDTTIL